MGELMQMGEIKDIKYLKKYLLGKLSKKEIELIDIELIENDKLVENLSVAEDSLIEDFIEGELDQKETKLFNTNFLVSKERKLKIETIYLLKKYSNRDEKGDSLIVNEDIEFKSFFERLREIFHLSPQKLAFTSILIFIMLGIGLVYLNYFGNLSELEQNYARMNSSDLVNIQKDNYSQIDLISGISRSSNKVKTIAKDSLNNDVFFRLALESESDSKNKYRIELIKDDKIVFRVPEVNVYRNIIGKELRLILPQTIFETGLYQIKATKVKSNKISFMYSFYVK